MKKLQVTVLTFLAFSFHNLHTAAAPVIECLAPIDGCHIVFLVGEGPMYPTRASSRGIEGWATVSFTITIEGAVSDVQVIDANPPEIFDTASIRAIQKFRFEPRMVNGVAVPVHGVQHTFRYSR